jgi:hypothetical protein
MKTSSSNKIPIIIITNSPKENNNNYIKNNFNNLSIINTRNKENDLILKEKSKTNSNSPRERLDSLSRGTSTSPKIIKKENEKEKESKLSSNKSLFSNVSNLSLLHVKKTNVNIFKENFKKPKKKSSFKIRKDSNGIDIEKIYKNHHISFNKDLLIEIIDVESYKNLNKIEINQNIGDLSDNDD